MADEDASDTEEPLRLSAEIQGGYDDVLDKLQPASDALRRHEELETVVDDVGAVLDAVQVTGGGIEGTIETESGVDRGVGAILRLLRAHDLVVLDERTWRPGPALRANESEDGDGS